MFSHIVIAWTDPEHPGAVETFIAGVEEYLRPIHGLLHLHVARCVPSPREVVDSTFQVALNMVFENRAAQDAYQEHPMHNLFVETIFRKVVVREVVYDFE